MEFLDISLPKDSSLLLHAIHRPFYWQILNKSMVYSGFKNPYKKSAQQENSSLFMIAFVEWKNRCRKPDKYSSLKRPGFRMRIHFFRIRRLRLETNPDPDPDPIRIQGFNDQKLKKMTAEKKIKFFWDQKLQFTYP
jgi:hypothetical protein